MGTLLFGARSISPRGSLHVQPGALTVQLIQNLRTLKLGVTTDILVFFAHQAAPHVESPAFL